MTKSWLLRVGFVLVGVAAAGAAACGDDEKSTAVPADGGGPDGGGGGDSSVGPSDGGSTTSDAKPDTQPTDAGSLSSTCGTGDLCFDVSPVNAGTQPLAGRVVVIWYQLNDDGPDPIIDKAFEAAFNGTETRIAIPLAQITPPTENNLLCKRACDDESICPCTEEPKAGTGYVLVLQDANGNGTIDVGSSKSNTEPIIGVARMMMGYSEKAFVPAPFPFDRIFPDGLEQGVRPYEIVRPEAGSFDRFGKSSAGAIWDLKVCDTLDESACDLPFPNPT